MGFAHPPVDTWEILDALQEHICVLRADATIVFVNAAWRAAWGEPLTLPAEGAALWQAGEADLYAIERGLRALLAAEREDVRHDYASANGTPQRFSLVATPCTVAGERGALVQRRVVPAAVEAAYLEAIFRDAQDALLLIDNATGTIRAASPAVLRVLGYLPDDLHDQPFAVLFPPDEPTMPGNGAHSLRVHNGVFEAQTFRHASGALVPLDLAATTLDWQGGQASLMTLHDASERQQAEQEAAQHTSDLQTRVALRTTEVQLFQALVENAPDGIFIASLEQAITYANPALHTLLSCGDSLERLSLGDVSRAAAARLDKLLHGNGIPPTWHGVLGFRRCDGTAFQGETSLLRIVGAEGETLAVAGIVHDITERLRMEKALHASEARLNAFFNAAPLGLLVLDQHLRYRKINEAAARINGRPVEHHIGKTIPEALPELADIEPIYREVLQSGQPVHNAEVISPSPGQPDVLAYWEVSIFPLPGDEGISGGVGAVFADISESKQAQELLQRTNEELEQRVAERTEELVAANQSLQQQIEERWRAEEAVRQSEEQLRRIVEHMPVLLDAFDAQGNIVVWNAECERVTGYSANEVIGNSHIMEWLYPDDEYRTHLLAQWSEHGHNYRDWEWTITARDGSTRTVSWSNISDQFPIPGWATWGIGVDVTQRKQAETALQAERAALARRVAERTADLSVANAELARAVRTKDEFLANMSHELRTPLNAILGLSEALQEEVYGPLAPRQQSALQTIQESGFHLLALINDILDLSKIEAGRADLHIVEVPLEDVCQASLRLVKQEAMRKRITLAENLDPDVDVLYADERRLKQMLVNLLSNAVKFTPEYGRVGLDVRGNRQQRVVHFTVWDTGIGIEAEKMSRLFKPFVQIDAGLNRQHEGTGLGLALVSRLTEMHGGSVGVESEPGKGSRFTVALPWYTSAPAAEAEAAETDSLPALTPTPDMVLQRALLVEDSATAASQLARYLKHMHIDTTVVQQGAEVVEVAAQTIPGIILLDILLPDVPGWEVLAALKADPRTAAIPVVIVSNIDDRLRGLALGAAEYLVKPVSRQEIQQVLNTLFAPTQPPPQKAVVVTREPDPLPDKDLPLIVLAEDNDDTSTMVTEYLSNKGYRVVVARNGAEAIEMTHEFRPALIVMDIQMPGMDGLEAIRTIRNSAEFDATPIVALTALAMPGDRERCLQAGANDYLSKPVSLRQLAAVIQELLHEGEE